MNIKLKLSELQKLKMVLHAISTEETRYYLNGVCLRKLSDKYILVIACDGHQLSQIKIECESIELDEPIILKKAFVDAICKIKIPRGANLEASLTSIDFDAELTYFAGIIKGKIVDGTFPDTDRVFPSDPSIQVGYNAKYLMNACKAVIAASTDKAPVIILKFDRQQPENAPALISNGEGGQLLIMPKRF